MLKRSCWRAPAALLLSAAPRAPTNMSTRLASRQGGHRPRQQVGRPDHGPEGGGGQNVVFVSGDQKNGGILGASPKA